jgi:Uma2 family endonuclease
MLVMQEIDVSLFEGETIRPLRRVEYDALTLKGFYEDEKVELLFGMVVRMSPIDAGHSMAVTRISNHFAFSLHGRAMVCTQAPFAASELSEPEPDVFVVPKDHDWKDHPGHAYLVVEVARSSLKRDRGPKAKLYAASSVEEYWIVDQINERVLVFRDPHEDTWRSQTSHKRGETIPLLRFPDVSIAVSDVLPPTA